MRMAIWIPRSSPMAIMAMPMTAGLCLVGITRVSDQLQQLTIRQQNQMRPTRLQQAQPCLVN